MQVTLSGIVTDFKLVQDLKAYFPMRGTLFCIVTDVKFVQSEKAQSPILVTPLPITTVCISTRTLYHGAEASLIKL